MPMSLLGCCLKFFLRRKPHRLGTIKAVDGETRFNAYAIHYRLNLFSNFTYFLDDPVNGDQFNQRDRRLITGGELARVVRSSPFADAATEDLFNGLDSRRARRACPIQPTIID